MNEDFITIVDKHINKPDFSSLKNGLENLRNNLQLWLSNEWKNLPPYKRRAMASYILDMLINSGEDIYYPMQVCPSCYSFYSLCAPMNQKNFIVIKTFMAPTIETLQRLQICKLAWDCALLINPTLNSLEQKGLGDCIRRYSQVPYPQHIQVPQI